MELDEVCPDLEFAKRKNPDEEHKWTFTALSELLVRIEEIKLSHMVARLVDHWGINPKTVVTMHDGIMVSPYNVHPDRALAQRGNTNIDQEVLRDVCEYVKKTLGVFIKLTVKQGKYATDLNCGTQWPEVDQIDDSNSTIL